MRRLLASAWLQTIDVGEREPSPSDELGRLSILSFPVLGKRWDERLAPLGGAACRCLAA